MGHFKTLKFRCLFLSFLHVEHNMFRYFDSFAVSSFAFSVIKFLVKVAGQEMVLKIKVNGHHSIYVNIFISWKPARADAASVSPSSAFGIKLTTGETSKLKTIKILTSLQFSGTYTAIVNGWTA